MTRMSVTDDQYGQLWRRLEEVARRVREGTLEFSKTMTVLQGVVEGTVQQTVGIVRLFVDYTRPFVDLIRDCGFDWVNNDITEKRFPITKRPNLSDQDGEVEMKIFHFNRTISSYEAIREMDKEGYRPAELPELLAFAKNNPDAQRKYPIVGLGPVWRYFVGRRYTFYLWGDSDGRSLDLGWREDNWGGGFQFLAVRKSEETESKFHRETLV